MTFGTTGKMVNLALLECNFSVALCQTAHICTLIQLWYSQLRDSFAFAEHTQQRTVLFTHTTVGLHKCNTTPTEVVT